MEGWEGKRREVEGSKKSGGKGIGRFTSEEQERRGTGKGKKGWEG